MRPPRGRPLLALLLLTAVAALAGCSGSSSAAQSGSSAAGSGPASGATSGAAPAPASGAPAAELDAAGLQARWWTWAASQVEAKNPVSDTTGAQCANGQSKDVWFLAGSFGQDVSRECTVPAGVPVAFPVVNLFGEKPDCDAFMAKASGTAVLDGEPLATKTYPATPITIEAVDGNPVTTDGGSYDTVACGIWAQAGVLPNGDHELVITGNSADFTLTVAYRLAVG